jgi:hypothetical protein
MESAVTAAAATTKRSATVRLARRDWRRALAWARKEVKKRKTSKLPSV